MGHEWIDRDGFPWETRWFNAGAGRMAWSEIGTGEAVVLVHGTPTWGYDWRHVVRALSESHRVIVPDHLGFGRSDRPRGADYSPEAHAIRFSAFLASLALDRVTLVMHDFGVPFALPWALANPSKVARLVFVNSWMWSFADDPGMAKKAKVAGSAMGRFLYRHLNFSLKVITPSAYGDRKKLTKALHAQYLAPFEDKDARVEVLWALAKSLLASSAHFQSLWDRRAALARVPAALLWGAKDSAFPVSMVEQWRSAFPALAVTTFDGAGHWPHEEVPDSFNPALRAFLASTPG